MAKSRSKSKRVKVGKTFFGPLKKQKSKMFGGYSMTREILSGPNKGKRALWW